MCSHRFLRPIPGTCIRINDTVFSISDTFVITTFAEQSRFQFLEDNRFYSVGHLLDSRSHYGTKTTTERSWIVSEAVVSFLEEREKWLTVPLAWTTLGGRPEAARTSAANVPASPARLDQQLSTQALPGSRGFSPSFILLLNRHDLEQLTTRLN